MSDFNPYVEWLEIDPALCPPNFYDLLGITPFENDAEVIEDALATRFAHVRTFQTGPRGKYTQDLLNELARARLCLLNEKTRAEYDEFLRGGLDKPPVLIDNLDAQEIAPPVAANAIQIQGDSEVSHSKKPKSRFSNRQLIIYVAACLVLLLAVWGIVQWTRGGKQQTAEEVTSPKDEPQEQTPKPRKIINPEEKEKGLLPGANNSFILTPGNAKIDQPHPELTDTADGPLFTNWKPADSKIRWELWINTPGYYEAIVSYNATTNDKFSRFIVQYDEEFPKKTKMRSAEKQNMFFSEEVVVLFRKPGAHVIYLSTEGDVGDFRFQSITLRPNRTTRE